MKNRVEYSTYLQKQENIDSLYCDIPFHVEETFGKKRVKIKATIDNTEYRGLLTPYNGQYFLMINKNVRAQVGKSAGELVKVVIEEDNEPRIVEIPEEFNKLMLDNGLKDYFEALSYTHQKEYVRWITEAKREETKQARLTKAIDMMKNKIKTPG